MARGRKRREVRREERVDPTPETLAKLTPDPLMNLKQHGLITSDEERAASEIRAVYMAVCGGLFRKQQRLGEAFGLGGGKPPEMPCGLARAHHETYLPWTRRHHPGVIDAVLSLVVDRNKLPPAFDTFVAEALKDYALNMGRRKVVDISAA